MTAPKTSKKSKTSTKTVTTAGTTPVSAAPPVPNVGLATLVKQLSAQLDQADAQLGPEAPSLTGLEKRRTAKARKGSEKIMAAIGPIAQQHGLESPSLSVTAMNAKIARVQTLQPLQSKLQKMKKRVDDEVFDANGDAWQMALQFYTLMKHRAKSDGGLASTLEPVTKMFAYRHPLVKAEKPTKVQTRAKSELKSAVALAERHGVPLGTAGAGAAGAAAPVPAAAPVAATVTAAQSTPVAMGVASSTTPAATGVAAPTTAAAAAAATAGSAVVAAPAAAGSGATLANGALASVGHS